MLYMLSKGPFYASARNDALITARLETLIAHYTDLHAKYLRLGLKYEAQLFAEIVEDLKRTEQELSAATAPAPESDPVSTL